ncbi:RagB/SusD family nutrient uptake outer membrane protein [Halalkalibaculum sp. DA384]|uniref:RagB/SusD family nutrient uptake outer membrane protein n=1 Tax=Halalkalibaculum sp. DA384 TaxID=3373606 RepID=UPI0037541DA3
MRQIKIISAILLIALVYASCNDNFLDIKPTSSLTTDTFYQSVDDAQSAVNAAYASLQLNDMYSDDYPKIVEGPSDDVEVNNTGGLEFNTWSFSPSIQFIDDVWQVCYEGVFRSNLVLQHIPEIDMDESLKARFIAEAQFLRALYYWHLTTLFGDVPLIKEANPNDLSNATVGKTPKAEVYDFMVSDLQKAIEVLPTRSEYSSENLGRATKGAAQALLGKIYLYAENYEMAETTLDKVINSGEYSLVDDYTDLWVEDNNSESIFEVQYANVGGSTWSGQDGPGVNESNLRLRLNLPQGHGGFANLLPTQDHVDEYEDYSGPTAIDGKDPRLFYNVFTEGDPFGDTQYSETWTPLDYTMKKGMLPHLGPEDANPRNIPIIRLGDVILMAAEAANRNGDQAKAIEYLNDIRDRPSVDMPHYPTAEYPVGNEQEVFEAIVHERRVELAFEYQRLHDLRRWGLGEEQLGPIGYQAPKHRYFPIPQAEVDINPELDQNPNY